MGDDPKKPFVLPGEIISQEQREKLGLNRLRRWFENGTLQLAEFVAPEPQRRLALQTRAPVAVLDDDDDDKKNGDGGVVILPEEAGLDTVEKLVEEVIEPKVWVEQDQAREDRNAKAREKRASDKVAKAKRDERNRKAREKRAASREASDG